MSNSNSSAVMTANLLLGDVYQQYVSNKYSIHSQYHLIKEYRDFKLEMKKCFLNNLKKSSFFIELIKIIKSTKIKDISYRMGVFLIKIEGTEGDFMDTDLERIWVTDGLDVEKNEEPKERVYQKELDALNFLETIWTNDFMLDKPFFYEFNEAINEELSLR